MCYVCVWARHKDGGHRQMTIEGLFEEDDGIGGGDALFYGRQYTDW